MSIESRIAYLERCDNCIAPPGTRCESSPGGCLYQIEKEYSEKQNNKELINDTNGTKK
jgi:hypothetical protein